MAKAALKGLTIKIGGDTSDLLDSLKDVEKRGKSLSGELGQINKLLKLDPKNTELLAQKQKVLGDAIANTEKKLDTLREAEKQAQEQFAKGEIAEEQYRALQREIIETENKLKSYERAVEETADAQKDLAKNTHDAAEETEEMDDSANDISVGGLAAMAAAAAAAVTAIVALAEESREYRNEMGKLDTAFQTAGHSTEAATKTYEALQSVLGETEQAVEAANHLAQLCDTEEELAAWTDIATGVYATFGASLPIEGLTEAANETAKVGQLTGSLADALNWAGVNEEKFQEQLDACSNEQERQRLITKTLTGLYDDAAKQYKQTNKEVIAANKATEKWNKATAKIGKTVEPVITDIKEMGVVLLEDASEPLEDIATFIRKEVIPAITDISGWVRKNGKTIKAAVVGITAAMVAFKVATIATTVAHKGLKGALMATTVAQKALALAQAATPWGLAAVAIAGVTTALVAYAVASNDASQKADVLTKEERELMEAADEAAEAFRDQHAATDEALGDVTAEMNHTQDLADELKGLADASGKVKDSDKARAQFILNELNDALGTEYTMTGNVINNYKELKKSIDAVIQSKLANSLLEAANADYVKAVQDEGAAFENAELKEKDYLAQKDRTIEAQERVTEAWNEYHNAVRDYGAENAQGFKMAWENAVRLAEEEQRLLDEKKTAYDEADSHYQTLQETKLNYMAAEEAALQGNYQTAVDLLAKKGKAYVVYSDDVDEETAKVLAALKKEAEDARIKAELTKKNFQDGVKGFTKPMVTEAEKEYEKALDKFNTAYNDAYGIGENFGQGVADGIAIKDGAVGAAAIAQIRGAVLAAKEAAKIKSPSRVTRKEVGAQLGEGNKLGIEDTTKDVEKAASKQMGSVLNVYRDEEANAQRAFRTVADQQVARQTTAQMSAAVTYNAVLDRILAAIEKGQVLTIDGETLVGATALAMDNALGRRRDLAARGAL